MIHVTKFLYHHYSLKTWHDCSKYSHIYRRKTMTWVFSVETSTRWIVCRNVLRSHMWTSNSKKMVHPEIDKSSRQWASAFLFMHMRSNLKNLGHGFSSQHRKLSQMGYFSKKCMVWYLFLVLQFQYFQKE